MFIVPVSRDTRHLSRLFDETFDRFFGPVAGHEGTGGARTPALDVSESDKAYTVTLEVPGVAKEDVKVSIEGRQVSVQAQTRRDGEKKEGDRVVHRERSEASYARTFTLAAEVDPAETTARLDHGVLTLTLPKRSARSAAVIRVN